MTRRAATVAVAVALAALAATAAPATADWLVLADGGRIETRGPWEVRGGLVVFTLPNGTLSSLRGTEVDLDASRAATDVARRPASAPAQAAAKPKARLVLTEADLPPVTRLEAEAAGTPGEGGDEQPAAVGGASATGQDSRLQVVDWNATTPDDFDGTVVTGRVRNIGDQLLTQVMLEVSVFNSSGVLIGRSAADVASGPLAPDRLATFEVRFQNLFEVAAARFNARGVGFLEGEIEGRSPGTPAASDVATTEP